MLTAIPLRFCRHGKKGVGIAGESVEDFFYAAVFLIVFIDSFGEAADDAGDCCAGGGDRGL